LEEKRPRKSISKPKELSKKDQPLFKANPMPNFDKRKFTLKLSEKKLTKIQGPNLNVASRAASRLRKEQDKDVNSENSFLS